MDKLERKLKRQEYNIKNKELLSHNRKQYYEQHKEMEKQKALQYYYDNKHKWGEEHFEKRRVVVKRYYQKHKDEPNFREKIKLSNHSRYLAGILTKELLQKVYEDNIKFFGTLTCVYCQKPIPFGKDIVEHRIPVSKGGLTVYANLVISCKSCNSAKGDKTWKEFFWKERT